MDYEEYFNHKTVLITGAGSGIGKVAAERFFEFGSKLILIDADLSFLKETELDNEDNLLLEIDLTDSKKLHEAFHLVAIRYETIHCAFNGAGIGGEFNAVENYSLDNWNKVMAVNLTAVFECMKYEIPLMLKNGGSIVNCGSLLSEVGYANDSAYVASKHAVVGLSKSAALEYASKGVRINVVSPGFTETPMTGSYDSNKKSEIENKHALQRFANPNEIVDAIVWLCSDQSTFVCGHNLIVDGGYTIQ